jgi:multiple sugar transport system permease protein
MSLQETIDSNVRTLQESVDATLGNYVDLEKTKAILVFMLPGMTLFAIFSVGPMAYSVFGSFFGWDTFTMGEFVGLENWERTLGDQKIIHWDNIVGSITSLQISYPLGALPQNLLWMLIHVPLSTVLGLVLALLFADLRGRRVLRAMVFVAFTTPTIVIGLILLFIYDPNAGIFNALLGTVGLEAAADTNWLQESQVAIYALIAGSVWVQTGFSMLLYSSALAGLDPSLLESARIDGAGPIRRFKDIIWPMVKPVTAVVVIMGMIWVLRIFALVYAAGGPSGGPNHVYSVLGIEVYRAAFTVPVDYGKSMVIALVELVLAIPLAAYIAQMD